MTTIRKNSKKTAKPQAINVGDRVRLLRSTRHNMIAAGTVGVVEEIRTDGVAPGISVRFPHTPSPMIARMFPDVPHNLLCLFSDARTLEVVKDENGR